jgi:pseudouridine synthase
MAVRWYSGSARSRGPGLSQTEARSPRCDPRDARPYSTAFPARQGRWIAVGRLDLNSSGLMLFTTDGELAHRLMHPSTEIERNTRCACVVGNARDAGTPQKGVALEDGVARFDTIMDAGGQGTNHWYHVILREGVSTRYGDWGISGRSGEPIDPGAPGVTLPRGLKPGRWEECRRASGCIARGGGMPRGRGGNPAPILYPVSPSAVIRISCHSRWG